MVVAVVLMMVGLMCGEGMDVAVVGKMVMVTMMLLSAAGPVAMTVEARAAVLLAAADAYLLRAAATVADAMTIVGVGGMIDGPPGQTATATRRATTTVLDATDPVALARARVTDLLGLMADDALT